MGNPRFLDSAIYPFRYLQNTPANPAAVTSSLRTELLALSWTEPVAGTFRSPANGAGRYMDLVITEPTATKWQMSLWDDSGINICNRRISVIGGVSVIDYYTGKAHVFLDNPSISHNIYAFLLDSFPDEERNYAHPAVGNGTLTTGDVSDGLGYIGYVFAVDNSATNLVQRMRKYATFNNTTFVPRMASGRYLYDAVWIEQDVSGVTCWTGKFPQALFGPVTPATSTDWIIPINYSTSATFRATSLTPSGSTNFRMFMRKA